MPIPNPSHSPLVQASLAKLGNDRAMLLDMGKEIFAANNAAMFPLDLLAFGVLKRAVSTISAFNLLIDSWNMVTARTLLRTHIDTALRFSATWLVSEPHQFAIQVIGGTEIRKIKDRNGQLLTDKYLYECMSVERPWLPTVYKELSGYIHFSSSHVVSAINSMDGDGRVSFLATEQDLDYPEESWLEAIGCFRESTEILVNYLQGYATTKGMPPTQFAKAREIFMNSRTI